MDLLAKEDEFINNCEIYHSGIITHERGMGVVKVKKVGCGRGKAAIESMMPSNRSIGLFRVHKYCHGY